MVFIEDFMQDSQGRRFSDVVNDSRLDFKLILDFFNREGISERLEDSEMNHQRPALAGVIRELENLKEVDSFFKSNEAHTTVRFRQAVGVLVKLHMINLGWTTTNRKGSLGSRKSNEYVNTTGSLSKWFTKAEHYVKTQ